MTRRRRINLPASVHDRLLNLRDERGEDFHLLLTRYTLERLLYRLSKSEYTDRFILKGALLLIAWTGYPHRPTQDLDLLGHGDASAAGLKELFQQICRTAVEADGLVFDPESVTVREIREDQTYESQRVRLMAHLGNARIQAQVDIGFGDVVTPGIQTIDYPVLLEFPAPRIRAYPVETVIAEKVEAMVTLGMQNSRMKDFYDLWLISQQLPVSGSTLVKAIRATFDRRETSIPDEAPVALSEEFTEDANKIIQWQAFLRRSGLEDAPGELSTVVPELQTFLTAPLVAAAKGEGFNPNWKDGGPWS